jgi:hypothetical protein
MSTLHYMEIDTSLNAAVSGTSLPIRPDSAVLNTDPGRLRSDYPAAIPASQTYYWTRIWQAGERAALEEIRLAQGRYFSDPHAAIRWLLSPED